jgi:transketolase
MESFGASGEAGDLFKHFGFSQKSICKKIKELV